MPAELITISRVESMSDERYAAIAEIRRSVFVVGQQVPPEREVDGLDSECTHFLAHLGANPVGAARFRRIQGRAKVERVAVLDSVRGLGVGRALMVAMEREAVLQGISEAILSSQVDAIPFYERLGYAASGPVYIDGGIDHRDMNKRLASS